ncbi:hypothetical protein N7490_004919 [Penicillium lividum]|nr:hypothetical protein N7490_004919 [Penicillium lividum]
MHEPTHVIDPDDSPFADGIESEPIQDIPYGEYKPAPEPSPEPALEKSEPVAEEDLEPAPEEPAVDDPAAQVIFRIQVSAKHLSFASPVFKTMLKGGWKESTNFLQKGTVEFTAESWDAEALLILFRAMHGQYRLITQKLTLEMLAKVTVIDDYYECKDALFIMSDKWMRNLDERIILANYRNLILSVWVSWFFQLPGQFKNRHRL